MARWLGARALGRKRLFENGKALAHLGFELLALWRQLHGVAGALEQGDALALFKLADAMADGAVGEAKLLGGLRIGFEPGGGFEGAERLERG